MQINWKRCIIIVDVNKREVKKAMPIKIKDMILYSVPEVAQKLNVTTVTIRNYLRQKKLKGQKLMGRWFISEEDLISFFEGLQ